MSEAKERRRRDSLRFPSWDYTSPAWYFITICTKNRQTFFGDILDDEVRLSVMGRIVEEEWNRIPSLRSHVILDEWVVMPNHLQGAEHLRQPILLYKLRVIKPVVCHLPAWSFNPRGLLPRGRKEQPLSPPERQRKDCRSGGPPNGPLALAQIGVFPEFHT